MLLDLQLRLNADVFEVVLDQLRIVDEVTSESTRHRELGFEPLGMPGFRQ